MIDLTLIENCENRLNNQYKAIEDIALFNQQKVLNAFKKNKIALRHFSSTSGYGYGDDGRDTLNNLFADIFNCEKSICSPSIVSGTHAISLALYGILRPNDNVLSITGEPYDTLHDIIYGEGNGSLKDFNISFNSIELIDGNIDYNSVKNYLLNNSV